jgi:predicted HicB family RNase H-like nuclease
VSDPKPFASLSSGLLARKGAARPAMRPQGFSSPNSGLEDLGWNDMGQDSGHDHAGLTPLAPHAAQDDEQVVEHPRGAPNLGLSPVASPVHSQQAELAERLADSEEDFDEEYDETAEPYEPEGGAAGFNGFDLSDEEEGEDAEPEFRVQFKGGKKPLDLGPAVEVPAASEPELQPEPEAEAEEDVLDLVEEVAAAPAPVLPTVPAPAAKAKAAFTLRLDPQRHLKLRLACAVRGGSAQQLVTDALDRLLASMPELDELADKARQRN